MEDRTYAERARRVFLSPRSLENDRDFRETLAEVMRIGLQWGGMIGGLGMLVLGIINWGVLGRPTMWWYPETITPATYVLWDKGAVMLACAAAVGLGRSGCRLRTGRLLGGLLAVGIAAVSLVHDAFRGILSVEYVILVNVLTVAVIPYRPWQALLLGGMLLSVFFGIGHYGVVGTRAANPELVQTSHLLRTGFASAALAVISALLLSTRYQQHRARRTAERLHDQVAELERAKSRFFADVSHEFRTPLTLLLGSIREALDGRFGDLAVPLQHRLDLMEDQGRRMERLVNQLLELSALDEGRLQLALQEVDLVALARRVVPPFRQWAQEKGISLQCEIDADRLNVWMDPDRFAEILATLLTNAITYTPDGGTVRVRIGPVDGAVEVAIRDTGPGLPEGLRARVFGQEESAIPVGKTQGGPDTAAAAEQWIGMGIGLAHTRALVQRHQGQIDVESEPGFGTEFVVRLPRGDEHVSDEDVAEDEERIAVGSLDLSSWRTHLPGPETEAEEPEAEGPAVLVVDDEAEMRDYLQSLLRPTYRVVTASDGDDALEVLQEQRLDLVISDTTMPGRDGVALCRAIRADEQHRSLPVILLTAQSDDDTRLSGLQAGADAYVAKPFDPLELEARIENLIEIRQLVQAQVRVPEWMEPKDASVASEEADFLESLSEIVDEHIDNSNFGVDWLADEMDLSTRHLRRKLKDVTRLSPAGFIRTRRLQHAAALLEEGADTISDVADAVGYRDASYFSRLFRETHGCPPTEYAEQAQGPPEDRT
ncbi:ATPase [Salinibacter sp. 10B]|uniref:response regulator n=1 Tax=Salinibacter sp. 10B TaxID=1923971 RepID=UPI000CF45E07|nr:response regulator [Salinibacter sp. 10B]PQJ34727.1 ATPase [Salinibacter sp. 10B]